MSAFMIFFSQRTSAHSDRVALMIRERSRLSVYRSNSDGRTWFSTEKGRRFPVGRCLVPTSHFFEFTGTKSPKTKWKFTKADEAWFCFAGLWRPMAAGGEAFTLLTTDPSPDVAPIHDRQMVVLERSDWSAWLEQTGNDADTCAAGRLPDWLHLLPPSREDRLRSGPPPNADLLAQ